MLELSLDELFGPEIVKAFQEQWAAEPSASAAQAEWAIQKIVAPTNGRESFLAEFLLALVGPEPDGLAWLEALAVGRFKLRDNVTYAIGRVGESPAKFIDRQRQRIDELARHPKAKGRRADYVNAYNDALRLVVATTLLTQLRTGVAAKAAIGAGWPLMAAVHQHFTFEQKRSLYWFGADKDLQTALADAALSVLNRYWDEHPEADVPRRADFDRNLPPGVDLNEFFRPKENADFAIRLGPRQRRAMPIDIPDFVQQAASAASAQADQEKARWRAKILLAGLYDATTGAYPFALTLRAEARLKARERWLDANTDEPIPNDFHIQSAIWSHVRDGGFMPAETPIEYVHYVEEAACHAFHTMHNEWPGLETWKRAGYFGFEPELMRLDNLDV